MTSRTHSRLICEDYSHHSTHLFHREREKRKKAYQCLIYRTKAWKKNVNVSRGKRLRIITSKYAANRARKRCHERGGTLGETFKKKKKEDEEKDEEKEEKEDRTKEKIEMRRVLRMTRHVLK